MENSESSEYGNPLSSLTPDMRRRIYSGTKRISARNAQAILNRLDKGKFADFIDALTTDALEGLCKKLSGLGISATPQNIGNVCADAFERVLNNCSNPSTTSADTEFADEIASGKEAAQFTDENGRYIFRFTIGMDGVAVFGEQTLEAIDAWYYDKATDVLAEMKNECLDDTFVVEIEDVRIAAWKDIERNLVEKIENNIELTDYDRSTTYNGIKRDAVFLKTSLELFLSHREAWAFLSIVHPAQYEKAIMAFFDTRQSDLSFFAPNRPRRLPVDVYLNSNRRNAKHEYFVAHLDKVEVEKSVGGSGVYDLYELNVYDLTHCRNDVAVYYFLYLANLKLSGFNFEEDSRMLRLSNFWIGLH